MSNRDIEDHLKNIYGIEVSATMISKITDKTITGNKRMADKTAWRSIPGSIYGCNSLQREAGWNSHKKAMYILIGINLKGEMGILDLDRRKWKQQILA